MKITIHNKRPSLLEHSTKNMLEWNGEKNHSVRHDIVIELETNRSEEEILNMVKSNIADTYNLEHFDIIIN